MGVAPKGYASPQRLVELLAPAVVRSTRLPVRLNEPDADPVVLLLELRSREICRILPGLEGAEPSLLRDAVQLAFVAGAPQVHVVLVWAPGVSPLGLCEPSVLEAGRPLLADLHGATLLFPDLSLDLDASPSSLDSMQTEVLSGRLARRFRALIGACAADWTRDYQTALLDLPPALHSMAGGPLSALLGSDVAFCAWSGSEALIAAHGWRSAAAFAAGLMAARAEQPGSSCVGWRATLPPGRYVPRSRVGQLQVHPRAHTQDAPELPLLAVRLSGQGDEHATATIQSEPTLRRPLGAWPLPALREVKDIHRRLVEAASRFVFEAVDEEVAMALAVSLRRSVRAQIEAGLLVGPAGAGAPDIRGGTLTDPAAPGLVAVIHAQLRPWAQRVSVRVSVRQDAQPVLEVA